MPDGAFVIHYPNGDFEYGVRSTAAPEVGDTVRRRGSQWRVTTRQKQDGVVSLRVEAVGESSDASPLSSISDATGFALQEE